MIISGMSATAPVETKAKITPAPADAAPKTRRKWTAQEKSECLAQFAESPLKATDFCRKFGVNEATFSMWRRQARESGVAVGGAHFAEVKLNATKSLEMGVVTVHLPFGAKLEVHATSNAAWEGLGLLLKTLQS
jgi:transposase-like protein